MLNAVAVERYDISQASLGFYLFIPFVFAPHYIATGYAMRLQPLKEGPRIKRLVRDGVQLTNNDIQIMGAGRPFLHDCTKDGLIRVGQSRQRRQRIDA
jgi:hypothetical protein